MGNKVLLSLTDQDAFMGGRFPWFFGEWETAERCWQIARDEGGTRDLANGKTYSLFCIGDCGPVFFVRLTNWLFRKLKVRILRLKDTKIKPVSIQGYELLDAQKQANLLVFLASVGRYILMGLQLLFTVPLIFIIFPQTEGLAYRLLRLYLESDSWNLCWYHWLHS